jgi:hypothetical protein
MLESLRQWAVPGALLMAGAWFASGIVAWVVPGGAGPGEPGETRFYIIEGLHGLGEIGLLAALAGLYFNERSTSGRLGSVGFWSAFVGTVLLVVATIVGITVIAIVGDVNLLFGILFAGGLLGWLVGFPLLGIATLRAKSLPGWVGWLLIGFFPILFVLFLVLEAYGIGGVIVGLIWALTAYALSAHGNAPTHREAIA